MLTPGQKKIVGYYSIACIIIFISVALKCRADKNGAGKDDHPEYFTSILKRVDTTKSEHKDEALAYLDSAFNAYPSAGPGDVFSKDSIKLDIYVAKHDFWKAMSYADSMIALSENKTSEERWAQRYVRALIFKGACFYSLKRYDDAFHYFTLARKVILTKVKNKCSLAEYGDNTAYLLFAQHKYLLAASYFVQNYNELLDCGVTMFANFMKVQRALDNAGISYYRSGMPDSALHYYNAALKFIEQNEHRFPENYYFINNAKAVVYGNQAEILSSRGKLDEAEILYRKSIEGTSSADVDYTQSTQARLIKLYIQDSSLQKASEVLDALKESLDKAPSELNLTRWYKVKSEYYKKANNIPLAYTFQQKYINLKDSIEERDSKFTALDVSRQFEALEQKTINEILQQDNKQKTVYLFIAIIFLVMSVAIILLVWHNLRKTSRLNHEIQQKNQDLQVAFTSLEQSHRENTRITRIVAHDLKNPISAIYNLIYSLLKKEESPSKIEILELVKTACTNSMVLIKDLLDKEKKLSSIRKEMVDLTTLLKYCVELLQTKADEKGQQLILQTEHAVILLNRQKMWRVISNVVNNAIKFSPENAVIYIKLEKKEGVVLLAVKDNGIGIPAELKDKIFALEPEASRIGTAGEESYGLGLSIAKTIIEEHRGKIWFESEAGKGAVFFIELPYAN